MHNFATVCLKGGMGVCVRAGTLPHLGAVCMWLYHSQVPMVASPQVQVPVIVPPEVHMVFSCLLQGSCWGAYSSSSCLPWWNIEVHMVLDYLSQGEVWGVYG